MNKKHKRVFTKILGIREGDLVRINSNALFTWEDYPIYIEGVKSELGRVESVLLVNYEPFYIVQLLNKGIKVIVSQKHLELEEKP